MQNNRSFHGIYYFMGLVLEIGSDGSQLIGGMPGVPAGFEVLLEPIGTDLFRARGDPIDGSPIRFHRNPTREVTGMQVGNYELAKITQMELAELPVIERLLPPKFDLTPEKQAQFETLLQASLANADGNWIANDLPYPKHEFVQFITAQDQIIFHGSNQLDIEEFQPIRKSMELRDETGRGNIQGVYGTHDGLWAMFFAIIDRSKQKGSIRNGVMYFQNRAGAKVAVYNFSINQDQLEEGPYSEGALYLLPRTTFARLKLTPDSYANEWASEQPVRPLAKLHLLPEDFPFLGQISGHDDRELLRLGAISHQIRESAVAASLGNGRFEVTLPLDAEVITKLDVYLELQRMMIPAAKFTIQKNLTNITLIMESLPPAVMQMLTEQYQDFVSA